MEYKLIRKICLALSFLTLLPVCPEGKIKNEEFGRSIVYFSLAGLVIGLFNLCFLHLAKYLSSITFNADALIIKTQSFFSWFIEQGFARPAQSLSISFDLMNPWLLAIGLVLISTLLTGGLHLDGLMDTFDGIACGRTTRKEILEVMKDSRVGAFGAMSAAILIPVQVIALAQLDYSQNFELITLLALLLPAISRFMMVLAIIFQVEAKSAAAAGSSLAMFKKNQKPFKDIVLNLLWIKLAALVYIKQISFSFDQLIQLDLIFIPWMIASWFIYKYIAVKVKGHNGDTMGAGLVLSESLWWLVLMMLKGF